MSPTQPSEEIHTFDNGIKVYKRHLLELQIERYSRINLHEPEEEEWFLKIIQSLDPNNSVFIDIGAAIGYYVVLAKQLLPNLEIHAFEPLPEHVQYMKENLRLNQVAEREVRIYEQAMSSLAGFTQFFQCSYSSSLVKELHLKLSDLPQDRQITIRSTTLDLFVKQLGKSIDLVLMDVQGFEFDILRGALGCIHYKHIKTWIIGTHGKPVHDACTKLLHSQGYQIVYESQETKHQPDGILIARA